MFKPYLQRIVENCEGALSGVVMGLDGIAVDSFSKNRDIDMQTISMEFSFVLLQVRKAAEILEVGALEEVAICSESLTFLIRILNEEYFLGLALRPDGNFGKGRYLMRLALSELRGQL